MTNEIWKDIAGYEGLYQVSNMGRVKSLQKERSNGKSFYITDEKILKATKDKEGYENVFLYKNKKFKVCKVHRLVAIAFIYNPKNKPEVDHINTIRNDNRVENLRWVTRSENLLNPLTRQKRSEVRFSRESKKKISDTRKVLGLALGKNNPNYKGFVCIFPSGKVTEPMLLNEIIDTIGLTRWIVDNLAKTKKSFVVSKYARVNNREHLKTLEGIRVLKHEDYLLEVGGGLYKHTQ